MLTDRLRCWINLHEPVRPAVRADGAIFRSHCRHCQSPIYRETHQRWREDRLAPSDGLQPNDIR